MYRAAKMVVDASVAAKWHLIDEEGAPEALALLSRFSTGDVELFAPGQIRSEVASALSVATLGRQPRVDPETARLAVETFLAFGLSIVDDDQLILEALPLVGQHSIAFYDALYLALAQRLAIPLVTADRKLFARCSHLPEVLWIADHSRHDA